MIAFLAFFNSTLGRYLLIGLLVAASYGAAYMKGRGDGWDKREAQAVAEAKETSKQLESLALNRGKVTERVVTKYQERVKIVKVQGEEVIREIERLIPVDSCNLDPSWRVLHDAAVTGRFPEAATGVNDASGVPQDVAARTVIENYAIAKQNAEQLAALQDWVRQQSEVTP